MSFHVGRFENRSLRECINRVVAGSRATFDTIIKPEPVSVSMLARPHIRLY